MLFFDGFDGYDAVTDLGNYGGWNIPSNANSISSTVRIGSGKSIRFGDSVGTNMKYTISADQAGKTVYIGFALLLNTAVPGQNILEILNSASSQQCLLYINSSRVLEARTSGVLSTGTTTLSASTWYYIEVKILVDNSAGIFDCLLNGVSEFTFSGDTQGQSTNSVSFFRFTGTSGAYLDDLYILNNDGSVNNTYLGEVVINRLAQTGDSSVAFTRNTGATNYEAIDDMLGAPDDATTYVYATTSGTKDEYTLSNTASANTIYGVKVNTRAQKDDVNPKSFKNGIKTGATDQQVTHSLGIGYANYIDIFETSDGGTTLWTPTTLDAAVSTIEVV
jgi:hypothetical protein